MNPGDLRHRITIQEEEVVGTDDDGFDITGLVDVCKVWTAIKTIKGYEYVSAAATQHENTYRFIIRYRKGIDPRMIVNYQGRIFEIESILNDDELKKYITIIGKERI